MVETSELVKEFLVSMELKIQYRVDRSPPLGRVHYQLYQVDNITSCALPCILILCSYVCVALP
jgi:hypothetical protein